MRPLLLLFILLTGLATFAWGGSYACRDGKGTLYFTDNPLRLPEPCRKNMWQIKQQEYSADSAPTSAAKTPGQHDEERLIDRMIREDALERRARQLRQQAAVSVEKYTQGIELTKKLNRSWHYGVRARQTKGNRLLTEARQEKLQLLTELESLGIPTQQRAEIEKLLDAIP